MAGVTSRYLASLHSLPCHTSQGSRFQSTFLKQGPLPLVLGRELLGQCAPNSAPQADAPPQPHSWSPGLPPPTGAGAYSKSTVWTHTPAWGLTLNISTDRTLSLPDPAALCIHAPTQREENSYKELSSAEEGTEGD